NAAELSSYDTTLFFVVLYLPIIPLGRKRILDQCSRCKRHFVAPMSKWAAAQEKDIVAANQAAAQDPKNEQKAATAIATAIQYHAKDEFQLLAESFGAKFPRSQLVHNVIGDGHAFFSQHEKALQAYRNALAAKDDPALREVIALQLIRTD